MSASIPTVNYENAIIAIISKLSDAHRAEVLDFADFLLRYKQSEPITRREHDKDAQWDSLFDSTPDSLFAEMVTTIERDEKNGNIHSMFDEHGRWQLDSDEAQ